MAVERFALFARAWMFLVVVSVLEGCKDNMFTGSLTPVPPVHHVPEDIAGAVILIDQDAIVETNDPDHIARANNIQLPRDLRLSMTNALVLAGFKVTRNSSEPHDMVAKLAIRVSENGDDVRQVYRCGLAGKDGVTIAQIDWTWPKGTFVGEDEVYAFATHNVATEVATSRRVQAFLREKRNSRSVDAHPSASDAGASHP